MGWVAQELHIPRSEVVPSLTEDDIKKLIQPFDEKFMQAHTVPNFVNSAKNHRNIAEAVEEVEYEELPD
jgi:hypothetical protein